MKLFNAGIFSLFDAKAANTAYGINTMDYRQNKIYKELFK